MTFSFLFLFFFVDVRVWTACPCHCRRPLRLSVRPRDRPSGAKTRNLLFHLLRLRRRSSILNRRGVLFGLPKPCSASPFLPFFLRHAIPSFRFSLCLLQCHFQLLVLARSVGRSAGRLVSPRSFHSFCVCTGFSLQTSRASSAARRPSSGWVQQRPLSHGPPPGFDSLTWEANYSGCQF